MRQIQLLFVALLLTATCLGQDKVTITVLETGYGPSVEAGEDLVVSFRLFDPEGELIDQATERNPLDFKLGSRRVVPGFSQGVEGMKLNEVRRIEVPPSLAYKNRAVGKSGASTTLIFEVKLLRVGKSATPLDDIQSEDDGEEDLKNKFLDDEFLNQRHARDVTKPAMFEYIIRDFFTKPWRYEDGHNKILEGCLKLVLALVALIAAYILGLRQGWLSR